MWVKQNQLLRITRNSPDATSSKTSVTSLIGCETCLLWLKQHLVNWLQIKAWMFDYKNQLISPWQNQQVLRTVVAGDSVKTMEGAEVMLAYLAQTSLHPCNVVRQMFAGAPVSARPHHTLSCTAAERSIIEVAPSLPLLLFIAHMRKVIA